MGIFDKFKDASNKLSESSSLTADEKEARKLAKAALKADIVLEQPVHFIAGRELVSATSFFGDKMYQLKSGNVVFNLDNPVYFRISSIKFAGPIYHEEQKTQSQSDTNHKSKTKKHRHGLGGAVVGTLLMPGVGTIAGAVIGGHSGKDKTKGHSTTQASSVMTTSQVEDDSSTTLFLVNNETGEKLQIVLSTKTADYQKLLSFKVDEESEKAMESSETVITSDKPKTSDDPIEQVKQFKSLLDDGIITQEEFDAKKKQLLGL
ncbi:SHOCT domain-containing protein [Lacticaseibacillus zeae]|uniref:SHOCT domain-containing protein n=1 Tax=Lacticaseibacillus zeae subsp. silagei TaxID=3068307 RepID=A0ABD7ZC04_LACZE|nr:MULTISPECIES: SHOCT domain-containing protein [Lacticaseibacillus]MDE3314892.1 SHOCT domain-containing protein [Lacticaseibacillus zeae]OFR94992.1 hypothetical protein HMPREF2861_10615 [Lactobacillus sp. HMSC068F07]WLV84676.1 SHOCT domain-containing protein [Lacticaseibacillus sp. NCIMB 15475]WLV87378.1 SHOCT domain-containing protein [Lacticaseibacillus sp. NCIMB 15474]